MVKYLATVLLCMVVSGAYAQQPKKEVREGNKLYEQGKYKEATDAYGKALQKQPSYIPGLFNMGNAQYKQGQFEASRKIYEGTVKTSENKKQQAAADYNIGNTYLEEKKYKEAVEAYKNALRKNPEDEQAKYNLSYALEMLKNQQGGGGDDKNDKKDNKDDKENKDKNKQDNKDENKDKQDNKDQQNKEGDKDKKEEDNKEQQGDNKDEQQKEQRPESQPSKLSEQQAEQLLNALQQEEKKLQDKMKKGKAVPIKVEKDW